MYDYNTTRPRLMLKEYGRNIQKLIAQLEDIKDKDVRTPKAEAIIKLMQVVNPNSESLQKRWDDLFILSDYTLDVNGPKPVRREKNQPHYVNMPLMTLIKYKYYGRHMEVLLKKITTLSSLKEQEQMLVAVGKLMRRFSSTWNHDSISNERIIEDIKRMLPDGNLLDLEVIRSIPDDGAMGQKLRTKHYPKSIADTAKK